MKVYLNRNIQSGKKVNLYVQKRMKVFRIRRDNGSLEIPKVHVLVTYRYLMETFCAVRSRNCEIFPRYKINNVL